MSIFRRVLSLFLVVVLLISAFPVSAFAAMTEDPTSTESAEIATEESNIENVPHILSTEDAFFEENCTLATEETIDTELAGSVSIGNVSETVQEEQTAEDLQIAVASAGNSVLYSGTCGSELIWELDENGILTISGTGNLGDYSDDRPEWYDHSDRILSIDVQSGVTGIGEFAFSGHSNVTSITIPGSVCVIGNYAFASCKNLRSFSITDSEDAAAETTVEFDDNGCWVFDGCTNLTNVSLGNSVKHIPDGLFLDCKSLENVEVSDELITIGDGAFAGSGLQEISLPDNLREIGAYAFQNCDNLKEVTLPGGVKTVGANAFMGCGNLTSFTVQDCDDFSAETVFADGQSCEGIFAECYSLKNVTLGNSVKRIADYMFDACEALENVTVSDCLQEIGEAAFYGCINLREIDLPGCVTSIGMDAFGYCTNLSSFTIADSEDPASETIFMSDEDGYASIFAGCNDLMNVSLGNTVKNIPSGIFVECTALETVSFSDELISIGRWAFEGCALKEITIPGSVTSIGTGAFRECENLTTVTFADSEDSTTELVFGYDDEGNAKMFEACFNLENVYLGNSIKIIPSYMFSGCEALKNITLSDSVSVIEAWAFVCCHALEKIIIPASVTVIEECAFNDCDTLTIEFQGDAPEFGKEAFGGDIVTAYYPADNMSWTEEVIQRDYGGEVTWKPYASDSHEHTYTVVITEATCTEGGFTTYTCVCGVSYVGDKTDALGHTEVTDAAVAPTCTETGLTEGSHCSVCGEVIVAQETVSATGHNFVNNVCTVCGELDALAHGTCGEELTWVLDHDGTLNISGTGWMENYSDYFPMAPWHLYGYNNVIIHSGVTSIGDEAFHGSGMSSVTIPDSVNSIGRQAFEYCFELKEVHISDLSAWCGMSFYDYDSNPTYYAEGLILNGEEITELVIPETVTRVGSYAFYNCTSLTSVTLPKNLTKIGRYAFSKCASIDIVYFAGTQEEWAAITIESNNDPLKNATIHYNSNGPEAEVDEFSAPVHLFTSWDAEKQIAYFDNHFPAQVTEETDHATLENIEHLVGQFVLVDSVSRPDRLYDSLLSIKDVSTKSGIVEAADENSATIDGVTYPSVISMKIMHEDGSWTELVDLTRYIGEEVLYHICDGELVGIELMTDELEKYGSVVEVRYFREWNAETGIAQFGNFDLTIATVDDLTNKSFETNLDNLLGRYVLVKVSEVNGWNGALDYIKPVETTLVETDEGSVSLYHYCEEVLVKIEELALAFGTLSIWNADDLSLSILPYDADTAEAYTLSLLADDETIEFLNRTSFEGATLAIPVFLFKDRQDFVYRVRSGKCGDSLHWTLENGVLTVYGTGEMYDYDNLVEEGTTISAVSTPWYPVRSGIDAVVIEAGVTSIGKLAFAYIDCLKTAQIPDTIVKISESAFAFCVGLKMIYFGGTVEAWEKLKSSEKFFVGIENTPAILYSGHIFDIWDIENTTVSFGNANEGYYIDGDDYSRLVSNISETDKEALSFLKGQSTYNIDGKSLDYLKWGGSCQGLSVWTCLSQMNIRNAREIRNTISKLVDYEQVLSSSDRIVESAINYYHFQQQTYYAKQAEKEFMSLSNEDQIMHIKELGKRANDEHEIFLIAYQWFDYTQGQASAYPMSHAVIGYALEDCEKTINDITYTNRVLIYDCADPDHTADRNLYFNDDGQWCIPGWEVYNRNSNQWFDTKNHNGKLKIVTRDANILNVIDYVTGKYTDAGKVGASSLEGTSDAYLMTPSSSEYTLSWGNNRILISGLSMENANGENLLVSINANATADGSCPETIATAFLPSDSERYTVTSEEPMSFVFRNSNYYTGAVMDSSGEMTFTQDGMVSLCAAAPASYYLDIVANDGYYDLPWYKVEISGDDATEISTEKTASGIVIHCDNMDEITISVTDDDGTTEITTGSLQDSILISEDNGELEVLEDMDGDGEYENDITYVDTTIEGKISIAQEYVALNVGESAQLKAEVYPFDLMSFVQWSVDDESILSVDENGTVTALRQGTSHVILSVAAGEKTLTARCRVDVAESIRIEGIQLGTQKLTSELFSTNYVQFDILLLLPQNYSSNSGLLSASQPAAMALADSEKVDTSPTIDSARFTDKAMNELFAIEVLDDRRVQIVPTDYAVEHPKEVKSKYSGTITVTVQGMEYESEALTLTVKKTMPKLKATVPAFNSFHSGQSQSISVTGGTPILIYPDESKNTAKTTAIPDWLTLRNDILTLTEDAPLKSSSGKAYVLVETEEWRIPAALTLSVKNTYKAPGLKLSATSVTISTQADTSNGVDLKLQCRNKKDTLSALNVMDISTPADSTFFAENFDADDGSFTLKAKDGFKAGKLTLNVSFTDTDVTVPLTLTIKTQTVKLKTSKSSVSLNQAVADSIVVTVAAAPADYVLNLTSGDLLLTDSKGIALEDPDVLDISAEGNKILIAVNEKTPEKATYKLHIASGDAKTSMTIKVTSAKPMVSYKAAGSLDHSFPEQTVTVTPSFKNYSGNFTVASMTAETSKKVDATDRFHAEQDGNNIVIRCAEDTAVGIYTLKLTLSLDADTTVVNTVKVTVKRTAVKLKLSATNLRLNKLVNEIGQIKVTCTTKGYDFVEPVWQLMDKTGKESADGILDIGFTDGTLTIGINDKTAYGATYKVLVKANENAPAATLTVTIPTEAKSKVTANLKASGKIDVIRDGSAVIVTPSYKNCTDQTKWEEKLYIYSSADQYKEPVNDLFQIKSNSEGGYSITRADEAALNHSSKYKVKLTSTCGEMKVESSMISFKVTMGSAKLTIQSDGGTLFAKDKHDRTWIWLEAEDAEMNSVSKIEIKDAKYKDMFEIIDYGDSLYAVGYKDNTVHTDLITKKSSTTVTVSLNIFLEGNQTTKANTTAKLKLTIVK